MPYTATLATCANLLTHIAGYFPEDIYVADWSLVPLATRVRLMNLTRDTIARRLQCLPSSWTWNTVAGTYSYSLSTNAPDLVVEQAVRYNAGDPLTKITNQRDIDNWRTVTSQGTPTRYAIVGGYLEVHPLPDSAKALLVTGWALPSPFTGTGTENEVLPIPVRELIVWGTLARMYQIPEVANQVKEARYMKLFFDGMAAEEEQRAVEFFRNARFAMRPHGYSDRNYEATS